MYTFTPKFWSGASDVEWRTTGVESSSSSAKCQTLNKEELRKKISLDTKRPKSKKTPKYALFPSYYRKRVLHLHLMHLFLFFFGKKRGIKCSLTLRRTTKIRMLDPLNQVNDSYFYISLNTYVKSMSLSFCFSPHVLHLCFFLIFPHVPTFGHATLERYLHHMGM